MKKAMISIKGLPTQEYIDEGSDEGTFELMTDGEYSRENGISTFSYIESALTGLTGLSGPGGLSTTFNVEHDRVILRRGDGFSGDMIFSEKQKHHFLYNTPFGSIMMGIDTHSIKKNLCEDGGSLEIRYDIEVDNVSVSQNLFKIDIRTLPQ